MFRSAAKELDVMHDGQKAENRIDNSEREVVVVRVEVVVVVDAGKGTGCGETGGSFIYPNHGLGV